MMTMVVMMMHPRKWWRSWTEEKIKRSSYIYQVVYRGLHSGTWTLDRIREDVPWCWYRHNALNNTYTCQVHYIPYMPLVSLLVYLFHRTFEVLVVYGHSCSMHQLLMCVYMYSFNFKLIMLCTSLYKNSFFFLPEWNSLLLIEPTENKASPLYN